MNVHVCEKLELPKKLKEKQVFGIANLKTKTVNNTHTLKTG